MKKDPENCPYCETEEKGISTNWGLSPEGWQALKEKHTKEHCDICPICGQTITRSI